IIASFFVVVALAAIALLAITPRYTSTATILLQATQNLLDPLRESSGAISTAAARMDGEVELIRSIPNLLTVVADENLIADPEFGVELGLRRELLTLLRLD